MGPCLAATISRDRSVPTYHPLFREGASVKCHSAAALQWWGHRSPVYALHSRGAYRVVASQERWPARTRKRLAREATSSHPHRQTNMYSHGAPSSSQSWTAGRGECFRVTPFQPRLRVRSIASMTLAGNPNVRTTFCSASVMIAKAGREAG